VICHWDELESGRADAGHIAGLWTDLGAGAGTATVGLNRIRVDPGRWSTPFHLETAEEEIFFVLAGSGACLLDGAAFEVRPGDCIVHRAREAHTLRAGEEGLDVLAFGTRGGTQVGYLPRAGVGWLGGTWAEVGAGAHPYEREAAAGEPELPELTARPANVVNVDEVEGSYGGRWRRLGRAAGSQLTGLNWARLEEGEEGAPPHVHSADEEIFVVLEGEGSFELWPTPQEARGGAEREDLPIRAGHVISRPASSGVAHGIRAGAAGLTYLAYGTRNPNDACYYPRSNKIYFRGLGLIARLEDLDYDDGEP
jgi:uncharacterized cupin superfamily protein